MSKITTRRQAVKSPHSKKQREILGALEKVARSSGLKISAGQLRFAGLRLKGGSCLFRGQTWLVLDKNQAFDDLLDIYRQALNLDSLINSGLDQETVALLSPFFTRSGEANDQAA